MSQALLCSTLNQGYVERPHTGLGSLLEHLRKGDKRSLVDWGGSGWLAFQDLVSYSSWRMMLPKDWCCWWNMVKPSHLTWFDSNSMISRFSRTNGWDAWKLWGRCLIFTRDTLQTPTACGGLLCTKEFSRDSAAFVDSHAWGGFVAWI